MNYREWLRTATEDDIAVTLCNLQGGGDCGGCVGVNYPGADGTCSGFGEAIRKWLQEEKEPSAQFEVAKDAIDEQPTAQLEPIRINLNESIKVKLTDWGKKIYYHQYDRTNQIAGREICKPKFPKEDENGYTEFQLWCFIELYGEHIGMALPNVIEPLEIVYGR